MFRAAHVESAMAMYEGLFGFNGFAISERMGWQITGLSLSALWIGLFVIFAGPILHGYAGQVQSGQKAERRREVIIQVGIMMLFVLAVLRLLAQSYSPFLYFQF
jgi:alginate O-acetyltransferase complex protein AlgI